MSFIREHECGSDLVAGTDKGEHQAKDYQAQDGHGQQADDQFHRASSFAFRAAGDQRSEPLYRRDHPTAMNVPVDFMTLTQRASKVWTDGLSRSMLRA